MTCEEATAKISNDVYGACGLLETLADSHHIAGNGHHLRQRVAEFAAQLLYDRWYTARVLPEHYDREDCPKI